MGEVKSFFDLIPNRGMIFVTYVSAHVCAIVFVLGLTSIDYSTIFELRLWRKRNYKDPIY